MKSYCIKLLCWSAKQPHWFIIDNITAIIEVDMKGWCDIKVGDQTIPANAEAEDVINAINAIKNEK